MCKTEYIEWCDFCIEDGGNKEKPRILLIGDSITRDYKGFVMELLQSQVAVNMMASSRGMDNNDYYTELGYILNAQRFHYNAIHLNNGLHANHLEAEEYEKLLVKTIRFIHKNSTAVIVIALSTPIYRNEAGYDNEDNNRIIERNRRAAAVANHFDLSVNDLYTLSYGKEEIRLEDGLHYNSNGSRLQAEQVVKHLRVAYKRQPQ